MKLKTFKIYTSVTVGLYIVCGFHPVQCILELGFLYFRSLSVF